MVTALGIFSKKSFEFIITISSLILFFLRITNAVGITVYGIIIPLGNSIRANSTYTFEVIKKGFIEYSALEYLGNLKVIQIGIPENVKQANNENIYALSRESYRNKLIKRKVN